MWIVFYSFFIVCSLIFIPFVKEMFRFPKEAVFVVGGLIFIASSLMYEPQRKFVNKWISFVLMYAALSFGFFFFVPLVWNSPDGKVMWNVWNYLPTLNLILGLMMIKTLVEYTDSLKRWVVIAKIFGIMGFAFAVYAILQYFGFDQIFGRNLTWNYDNGVKNDNTLYMITFLGTPFLTANYIAILSPLLLIFKPLRYKIFYGVSMLALLLTNKALSIVAAGVGGMLYCLMTKNYKVLMVGGLVCFVGLLLNLHKLPGFLNSGGRLALWGQILDKLKDSPFLGFGLGSFENMNFRLPQVNQYYVPTRWDNAHNELLQIVFETGLSMGVFVIAYLRGLFVRLMNIPQSMLRIGFMTSFIAYLIISMGGFPLRIAPLALIGITLIAALEVLTKEGEVR